MNDIYKPIFIVGSGRSGTTLVYELLSGHPDVFWFSQLTNKYPMSSFVACAHKFMHMQMFRPSEADNLYRACGFVDWRKSNKRDVDGKTIQRFVKCILRYQRATGKQRFLNKQTANTQRIVPLADAFSDAFWIHVIRDPRAVTNSLLQVDWWQDVPLWWSAGNTPRTLAHKGVDSVAVCARHWNENNLEILRHRGLFGARYLAIKYEDLIKNPKITVANIASFCRLRQEEAYLRGMPNTFPDRNMYWKTNLSLIQIARIEKETDKLMHRFGYTAQA